MKRDEILRLEKILREIALFPFIQDEVAKKANDGLRILERARQLGRPSKYTHLGAAKKSKYELDEITDFERSKGITAWDEELIIPLVESCSHDEAAQIMAAASREKSAYIAFLLCIRFPDLADEGVSIILRSGNGEYTYWAALHQMIDIQTALRIISKDRKATAYALLLASLPHAMNADIMAATAIIERHADGRRMGKLLKHLLEQHSPMADYVAQRSELAGLLAFTD